MRYAALILSIGLMATTPGCSTSSPGGVHHPAPAAADPPPAASTSSARFIGSWRTTLDAAQERGVLLTRYALANPPAVDSFEGMDPNELERQRFSDILRLRDEEPGSPLLRALRKKLEDLDALRVTVTPNSIILPAGNGTAVTGYEVEHALADEVVIVEQGDGPKEARRWVVSIIDDNHIVMRKGRTVMPMTRIGTNPDLDPASQPHVSSDPPARPRTGMAGDDLELCMADYYACLDSMPPVSQDAMRPALALVEARVKQAGDSVEQRASIHEACENAVTTMRSAGMCE